MFVGVPRDVSVRASAFGSNDAPPPKILTWRKQKSMMLKSHAFSENSTANIVSMCL